MDRLKVHVPNKTKMRDKSKADIGGQLKIETLAKLIKIGKDKNLSRIKTIEFLIENYQGTQMSEPAQNKIIEPPKVKLPAIKKEAPKRLDLAAELAKLKKNNPNTD